MTCPLRITLRVPLLRRPWPAGMQGRRPCPVCGEQWMPSGQSYWPCHPGCLVPEQQIAEVLRALERREVALMAVYAAWRRYGMDDRYARAVLDAGRARQERMTG